MHVLVSLCNIRHSEQPVLGLLNPTTGQFDAVRLPADLPTCSGVTGIVVTPERVLLSLQNPGDDRAAVAVAILDGRDLHLCAVHSFTFARDVHSLWMDESRLYLVSTGTDEVWSISLADDLSAVDERLEWRPDPTGLRQDLHHLNAICRWNDTLVLSLFGRKAGQLWASAAAGSIVDITDSRRVVEAIEHPHSLAVFDGKLAYCQSRKRSVHILDTTFSQELEGYTRGLCAHAGSLFVGTSVGRRVSRSERAIDNPADPGVLVGRCAIGQLAVADLSVQQVFDLGAYGYEIYDLAIAHGAASWPTVATTELLRKTMTIREMGEPS